MKWTLECPSHSLPKGRLMPTGWPHKKTECQLGVLAFYGPCVPVWYLDLLYSLPIFTQQLSTPNRPMLCQHLPARETV